MINCTENNLLKIELPIGLLFKLDGDSAYPEVLETVIDTLNITDVDSFLSYIKDNKSGDANIDAILDRVYRVGFLTAKVNAVGFGQFMKTAAEVVHKKLSAHIPSITVTSTTANPTGIESSSPAEIPIYSEEHMETGLDVDESHLPEATITKMPGAPTITNLYKHYFLSELTKNPHLLVNHFKTLVSKNWLTTESGVQIKNRFDHRKIKRGILDSAKRTIASYYRNSADAISSFGGESNILFFTDKDRLPNGSTIYSSVQVASGANITIFTHEYTDTENIMYVLTDDIDSVTMYDIWDALSGKRFDKRTDEIVKTSVHDMDPTMKPKQVNKASVNDNIDNKAMLNTYFSIITINELDVLIDEFSQELNSTIKDKFRVGPIDVDKAGSSMETKMLRLGIKSTPKILTSSQLTSITKKIDGIINDVNMTPGASIASRLADLDVIKPIDGNGNNIVNHTLGEQSYTSIAVNVGPSVLVFSYDSTLKTWGIILPSPDNVERKMYYSAHSVDEEYKEYGKDISRGFKAVLNSILPVLQNFKNDFATFSSIVNKSIQLDTVAANRFLDSMNNHESMYMSDDTVNITPLDDTQSDGFLRMADTILASDILSNLPHDMDEASEYLFELAKGNDTDANVARALYYKFFHRGEYSITEIDPVTNMLTTTKHMSVYEKAMRYNDEVAWEALLSLHTQLHSTVLDNKTFLNNGRLLNLLVKKSFNVENLINAIDTDGLVNVGDGVAALVIDNINKHFEVVKRVGTLDIKYFASERQTNMEPTLHFRIRGGEVEPVSGQFTYQTISGIASYLKLPLAIRSVNFYDSLKLSFSKTDIGATSFVNNFFGNIILLRLANAMDQSGKKIMFPAINLTADIQHKVKYTLATNFAFYIPYIEDSINRLYTRAFKATIEGPKGTKSSISIYKNLSKSVREVISKFVKEYDTLPLEFMFKGSKLIETHEAIAVVEEFTKLGLKVGLEGKDVAQLNQRELATIMISSFLQMASKTKFTTSLSTDGTQSDRTKTDFRAIKLLDEFGDLAPTITVDRKVYLDESKLRARFFDEQKRSFSGLQSSIVESWKKVFARLATDVDINKVNSLRDVYNILQKKQFDYATLLQSADLVDNFSIIKKKISGKAKPIASLNYSMIQLSEIMLADDSAEKEFYLDMFFHEFMQYQESIGFNVSLTDIEALQERFEYLKDLGNNRTEEAKNLALKIYFYNEAVLEQELAQMGMGTIFQYHKSKVTPVSEVMNSKTPVTDKAKIAFLKKHTFFDKYKVSMTYEELFAAGPTASQVAEIKAILESNLSQANKLRIIQYLDIMTQLSPMYIERVKRNQANGTSGMNPVLASENKAGILLDKTTKTVNIDDPSLQAFILNSGFQDIDAYDGAQIAMPSYFYKINRSLGNRFNNFRSNAFYKSVNASKTKEGVAMYEKSATFSLFGWELINDGTPELHALHRIMMGKEKFNNHDSDFNGLYLLPKAFITQPENSAPYTQTISLKDINKHGEYLGNLEVTIDGVRKIIPASTLRYSIKIGEIKESSIDSVRTNKVFVPNINSKLDLYNYYGGVETNIQMLNSAETNELREKFLGEFSFGWVEYQLVYIMSNYSGTNGNYPIRNAEIGKINLASAVKTGRKNVNPSSALNNKYLSDEDITTTDVSNDQLYIILQAEHEFDVTKPYNEEESHEASTIAMMTQTESNAVMQGATIKEVLQLDAALAKLSDVQLSVLKEEMDSYTAYDEGDTAAKQYVADILRRALGTRTDADTAKTLLGVGKRDAAKVALDLRILVPILRTSVNGEFNKRVIKKRFPGGQYVVSPTTHQIKTYAYNGNKTLSRSSVNKYDGDGNGLNDIFKREIAAAGELSDPNWQLSPVLTINQLKAEHTETDYIYNLTTREAVRVIDVLATVTTDEELQTLGYVSPWVNPYTHQVLEAKSKLEAHTNIINSLPNYGETIADVVFNLNNKTLETALSENELALMSMLNSEIAKNPDVLNKASHTVAMNISGSILMPFQEAVTDLVRAMTTHSVEGNKLNWMQYFRNGVNMQETDEYLSYYLAGKLPKILSSKPSDELKLKLFATEMNSKTPAVPKLMWARFRIESSGSDTLKASPILGNKTIDNYYEEFEQIIAAGGLNNTLLTEFFAYVESFATREAEFTKLFRMQLEHMLEQDGWEYEPTEFYMPPQHMAAFLITYGDSIQDIVGTQKQPELSKLISIINGRAKAKEDKISEEERLMLETDYITKDSASAKKLNLYNKIISHPEGEVYLKERTEQQQKMLSYFKSKIDLIEKDIPKASSEAIEGLKSRAPLLLLAHYLGKRKVSRDTVLTLIKDLFRSPHVVENSYLMSILSATHSLVKENRIIEAVDLINSEVINFKEKWASTLANNFEKSLTFITSRIPSQAKQQTTVGKIKKFIYSTKNAIYVPIELIAISGGDYDIDKQNNMTWAVNAMGGIVNWSSFILSEDEGISSEAIRDALNNDVNLLRASLERIGTDQKSIEKQVNAFKIARLEHISQAVENYALHKLMIVSGSSKNAIEAATVTAMTKLNVIKEYMASFKINKEDIAKYNLEYKEEIDQKTGKVTKRFIPNEALFKLIRSRQLAIPYTPSTKMIYEKVNMDGAMGIAIFASAIKAYTAVFRATLDNEAVAGYGKNLDSKTTEILDEFNNNLKAINSSVTTRSETLDYVRFGSASKPPVKLVWKNPATGLYEETKRLEFVANSHKFLPRISAEGEERYDYPAIKTRLAKEAYRKLMFAITPEEEAEIISEYKDHIDYDTNLRQETQAWQDLSELLSAATDNAKELILSTIGANNTTSNIISTMVVMGVDLHAILAFINDLIISDTTNAYENDKTLVGKTVDFNISIRKRALNSIDSYSKIKFDDSAVVAYLLKNGFKLGTRDYDAEYEKLVKEQRALHAKYNPSKQLVYFNDAAREFTDLTNILKINTGMPNAELDVFNYLMQLENVIKTSVGKNIHADLKDFLDTENSAVRDAIIKEADKNKAAFNIPYIIYKNKLFFDYIKTLYESNKIIKGLTYTHDILYNQILPKVKKARRTRLNKEDLDTYLNLISNIAISTYYNKTNSIIDVPGFRTFDLSKASDRFDFISNITRIRDIFVERTPALRDNIIVRDLIASTIKTDPDTGKFIMLLGGLNRNVNDDGDIAGYKLAMDSIKEMSPELYNVYFNYSLIIDKGALSRTSLATVFGAESYEEFSNHVLELKNSGEMVRIVSSLDSAISIDNEEQVPALNILLPFTLRQFSTQAGFKNENIATSKYKRSTNLSDEAFSEDSGIDMDFDTDDMSYVEDNYDAIDMMTMSQADRHAKEKAKSDRYDVSNMNALYKGNQYHKNRIFLSKTNGLIYVWLEFGEGKNRFESFVPITKDFSHITNNIEIDEDTVDGEITVGKLKKLGYSHGWEINLPDGTLGRLLSFNKTTGKYYILTSEADSAKSLKELDKQTILEFNPKFDLTGNYIKVRKGNFGSPSNFMVHSYNDKVTTFRRAGGDSTEIIPGITKYVTGEMAVVGASTRGDYSLSNEQLHILTENKTIKKDNKVNFDDIKSGLFDRDIRTFRNYMCALVAAENSTYYMPGEHKKNTALLLSQMDGFMENYEEQVAGDNSGDVKKVGDFFDKLMLSENRENLYMFFRKNSTEKIEHIKKHVFGDKNSTNINYFIKLSEIKTTNEDYKRAEQFVKDFESTGKGLTEDIYFLSEIDFDELSVEDYFDMLHRFGITLSEYRNAINADVIVINEAISTKPRINPKRILEQDEKDIKLPFSIEINTSRSLQHKKVMVQNISPRVTSRLVKFLNDRFQNTDLKLLSLSDIEAQYPDITIDSKDQAFVNIGNRTIILIKERATISTMLHEMGHLYLAELRTKNMDLYEQLMQKMETSELFDRVNRSYANKNNYTKTDILEEVFVITLHDMYADEFSGQVAFETGEKFDGILDENGIALGKVKKTFSDEFKEFYGVKSTKTLELNMTDSIADIMRKIGIDIIFNKNSMLSSMSRNDIKYLKSILENKNMTELQAEQLLIKRRLIRKTCD